MKVILINPLSDLARSSTYFRSVTPLPPLGLASLAAVLKNRGLDVLVEDQYASCIGNEALVKKIADFSPQIIGFSCLTTAMSNVKRLVKLIKQAGLSGHIILGNIHPTIFTDETLENGCADIIVRGEGEESLLETIIALEKGQGLKTIKGISYLDRGKIFHNKDRQILEDLDSLPYPDWNCLDLNYYKRYPMLGIYNSLVLPVQASRGCAYNCLFCSQDKFYKKPRYRKISKVVDEIEFLYSRFRMKYVGFTDAYFPFSKQSGLEFCDEFIRRKLHKKIKWFTETRVDMVDNQLMRRMKESNLYLVMYGFESGNQKVLDSTDKRTTLEQARKAMEYTKKYNIRSLGLFMLGLPSDTNETCAQTVRFAKELDCDLVKFNIAVPFPGSVFFEENKYKMGNIDKIDSKFTSWHDWSSSVGEIIYSSSAITKRELTDLQRKGMFSFYMRPRIILKHLLKGTFSLPDLIFGAFLLLKNYLKTKDE